MQAGIGEGTGNLPGKSPFARGNLLARITFVRERKRPTTAAREAEDLGKPRQMVQDQSLEVEIESGEKRPTGDIESD